MNYKKINEQIDEKIVEYIGLPISNTTMLNMKKDFQTIFNQHNIYLDFDIKVNDLDLPQIEFLPAGDKEAEELNKIFGGGK